MNIKEKVEVVNQKGQMERDIDRRLGKRKVIVTSDSEKYARVDVQDIMTSSRKKAGGKKIPGNVPAAPLDNVSFHSESNAERWKYVVQSRISYEIELGEDSLEFKELSNLIQATGLWNIVAETSHCSEKLVKEIIVNVSHKCNN